MRITSFKTFQLLSPPIIVVPTKNFISKMCHSKWQFKNQNLMKAEVQKKKKEEEKETKKEAKKEAKKKPNNM
jgi:hypothetical protein